MYISSFDIAGQAEVVVILRIRSYCRALLEILIAPATSSKRISSFSKQAFGVVLLITWDLYRVRLSAVLLCNPVLFRHPVLLIRHRMRSNNLAKCPCPGCHLQLITALEDSASSNRVKTPDDSGIWEAQCYQRIEDRIHDFFPRH